MGARAVGPAPHRRGPRTQGEWLQLKAPIVGDQSDFRTLEVCGAARELKTSAVQKFEAMGLDARCFAQFLQLNGRNANYFLNDFTFREGLRGSQKLNQEAMGYIKEKLMARGKRDEGVANTGPKWWQDPTVVRDARAFPGRGSQLGAARMGTGPEATRGRQLERERTPDGRGRVARSGAMTAAKAMEIVQDIQGKALERVDWSAGAIAEAMHQIVGLKKRGELQDEDFFDGAGKFPVDMRSYMELGSAYNVLKLALVHVTRPELLEFWWELEAGEDCHDVNAKVGKDLEKLRELDPRSYLPDAEKLRQRTLKLEKKQGVGKCKFHGHGEGYCKFGDCQRWHVKLR